MIAEKITKTTTTRQSSESGQSWRRNWVMRPCYSRAVAHRSVSWSPSSSVGATPRRARNPTLTRHPVPEVGDARAERPVLDELQIHPALVLREERHAAADQHRVDPGPVLVDQIQRGGLGCERRAADRDAALAR